MIYRFNPELGKLEPNEPASFDIPAGAGPRHLVLHKNGRFAYLINELNSTIIALRYNQVIGSFHKTQILSTLPEVL